MPVEVIDKGIITEGLLAQLLVVKYSSISALRALLGTTLLVVPLFGFIWKLLKALG